jgi:hypothetical protein
VVHFVLTGGRQEQAPQAADLFTIEALFARYFEPLPEGAKEQNTLATERSHRNNLVRLLGGRKACEALGKADPQKYIIDRSPEKHGGRPIRAEMVKKELDTLRAVWNRARKLNLIKRPLNFGGLDWPERKEKHPFQTRSQIEQAIHRGGLSPEHAAALWGA